ncbi:MAG: hypothetical protein ACFFF4_12275 [Candidatus Thorarchaeota archaeon]
MIERIDKMFLTTNVVIFAVSILFIVFASLNGFWIFSIVIPIIAIHLLFSLQSNYQDLTRFYQEYSTSFTMNLFNITIHLFVYTLVIIGVLSNFEVFFNSFGVFFIAIIAMLSISTSSLVGEGLAQILYERRTPNN